LPHGGRVLILPREIRGARLAQQAFAPTDLGLTGAALLVCWLAARRAMRIDPMAALRCE
jgi:ABC-type lipoprotein release transport system permease subunit